MSNNQSLAIIPKTLDEVSILAERFAKSTLMPEALRNKASDVLVSIMAGAELGLSPMAAIRGVHVVQGKPILSADTMVGIVLGSGLCEYFICIEGSTTSATYETKRKGTPKPQRCTWTIEDAKRAGLIKDGSGWAKYPQAMVKARARAVLARDVYPDVLAGCYDESEEHEVSTPMDAIDAEIVERQPLPGSPTATQDEIADALISDIATAPTLDALDSLLPRFGDLTKKTAPRARANEALETRRKFLAQPAEETAA